MLGSWSWSWSWSRSRSRHGRLSCCGSQGLILSIAAPLALFTERGAKQNLPLQVSWVDNKLVLLELLLLRGGQELRVDGLVVCWFDMLVLECRRKANRVIRKVWMESRLVIQWRQAAVAVAVVESVGGQ